MVSEFNFNDCTKDELMKMILRMYKPRNYNCVNVGLQDKFTHNPRFIFNVKEDNAFFVFDIDTEVYGYVGYWYNNNQEKEYISLTGIVDKLWDHIKEVYK